MPKSRIVGPEPDPDDGRSLIRLLLYSDVLEIEGIVASTAAFLSDPNPVRTNRLAE